MSSTFEALFNASNAVLSWDWDQRTFVDWLKKFEPAMQGRLRVLSVGACGDILSEWLAGLGNDVTGVDWRAYTLSQADGGPDIPPDRTPNFKFIQGDFNVVEFEGGFDMALACSSIEHFGLGRWQDPVDPEGDAKAARRVLACLKTGGLFAVSVPYHGETGLSADGTRHRYYSAQSLRERLLPAESYEVVDTVMGPAFGGEMFRVARKL